MKQGCSMSIKRALFTSLLLSLPVASNASYWSPHVGVDYKYWDFEPVEDSTAFISQPFGLAFPKIKHGYNVYVGSRVNGYFGFDLGYESSLGKRQNHRYEGGELIFAVPEEPNNMTAVDTRVHDVHLDLNFYWEVVRRLDLIFMFGAAFLHFNTHVNHFTAETGTWFEYTNGSEAKWSGRLGLGAQFNPIPCFGIKFLAYSDQSQRLKYDGIDENNNVFSIRPYHKSFAFNLGVVYSFNNPRKHPYHPPEPEPFY